ncbi:MAG: aminotransferase class V-fold PLP-dependent enzyme [Alphaproteobacteria bacterium]|nr:aminotransferase class V-fold PLP-dependent enzyme [Alphaproteobacteria bacterium]
MDSSHSEILNFESTVPIVLNKLVAFLNESYLGKDKVIIQQHPHLTAEQLGLDNFIKNGGLNCNTIENFLETFLKNSLHIHHPQYFGHQNSKPILMDGVADLITGTINNPGSIYEMSPASLVVERVVINWLLSKLNWFHKKDYTDFSFDTKQGAGVITHGGSIANLKALLIARSVVQPEAWQKGNHNLVVLMSESAHYSMNRAVSILGLGQDAIVKIPVDAQNKIMPSKIPGLIEQCHQSGKTILCIVANACSTAIGSFDPLEDISTICKKYKIWFHVDAAHGGCVLNSEKHIHLVKGIEHADSVIWDMHKMMQTTALCTAVLVKNYQHLKNVFQQKGSYLFFENEHDLGFDTISYSLECTKASTALRFFFSLAYQGEKGLENYVDTVFEKAQIFYKFIKNKPDFEAPVNPESNIIIFRFTQGEDTNAWQLKLRNIVLKQGMFHITSTEYQNIRYLRLSIMNPNTDLIHIENLLSEIRAVASALNH